jgi:hypothetical protein
MTNVTDFGGAFIRAQKMNFVNCTFGSRQVVSLAVSSSISTYEFSGCYWNGSLSSNTLPPQIYVYPNGSNIMYLNFDNCTMAIQTNISVGDPFIINLTSTTLTVYAKFRNTFLQPNSSVNLFGKNINGYAIVEGAPFINVNINNFSITTPSIPSSGTAVTNTNPIDITVYLNGGTVTTVNKISGGNTYTVFSNSSGASLDNLPVHLRPNESISITYTAAPTWIWVPE